MPFKKPTVSFEEAMAGSRAERGLKALKSETGVELTPTAPAKPTQISPPPGAENTPKPPQTTAAVAAPAPPTARVGQSTQPSVARTPQPIAAARRPTPRATTMLEDDLKLSIPVTAPHPAPGVSPSYDAIAADHGPRAAILAVLKRAWPDIEAHLAAGEKIDRAATYPVSGVDTDTTRRLSPVLMETARASLDPHGISSQRKLGRMLATAALAAYFTKERAR
jgi:hypothetical protein